MKTLSTISAFAFLAILLAGCGVGNRLDATAAIESSALSYFTGAECHYTAFQTAIAPILTSQCISCHGTNGAGTLLLSGSLNDAALSANYSALLAFIDTSVSDAARTELIERIASGSALSHPYKQSTSSSYLITLSDWVDGVLADPQCQNTGGDGSGGGDDVFF